MNPLQARQRVDAVYTLKQADFASERQWNDYLEEKEEIIFNFTENIDVPATERKLRQYAEEHAAEIAASKGRAAVAEEETEKNQAEQKQQQHQQESEAARMSVDASVPFRTFEDTEEGRAERARVAREAGGADPVYAQRRAAVAAFSGLYEAVTM